MLKAETYYDKFQSFDRRAMQLTKFYLNKWGEIEKNISLLNDSMEEIAFLLYSALNELSEKEREFLGNKYRVVIFGKHSKPDRELAEEYEVKLTDYVKLRKGVEYKFYYYLKPLIIERKDLLL